MPHHHLADLLVDLRAFQTINNSFATIGTVRRASNGWTTSATRVDRYVDCATRSSEGLGDQCWKILDGVRLP